ncbi:MAG: hypothetical protein ACE5FW_02975 [Candidatus Aenigmatarchaeota archaeon]
MKLIALLLGTVAIIWGVTISMYYLLSFVSPHILGTGLRENPTFDGVMGILTGLIAFACSFGFLKIYLRIFENGNGNEITA